LDRLQPTPPSSILLPQLFETAHGPGCINDWASWPTSVWVDRVGLSSVSLGIASDALVVVDPGTLRVFPVTETALDGTVQKAEFFPERWPPLVGQHVHQVVKQGSESAVDLQASGTVLADFTHRHQHVIGPCGRDVDEPQSALLVPVLAVVELPTADPEEQVVDLVECEHRGGRVVDRWGKGLDLLCRNPMNRRAPSTVL
jgi:hypothetical protein